MTFRMIQAVILKCFERSIVEKIEENSNDVSRFLFIYLFIYYNFWHTTYIYIYNIYIYLYDNVNKYT